MVSDIDMCQESSHEQHKHSNDPWLNCGLALPVDVGAPLAIDGSLGGKKTVSGGDAPRSLKLHRSRMFKGT